MRYCWKGPYSSVKRLGRLSGRAIDASCSRYCSTAQTFNKVGLGHRFDLVVLTNTRLGPVFFLHPRGPHTRDRRLGGVCGSLLATLWVLSVRRLSYTRSRSPSTSYDKVSSATCACACGRSINSGCGGTRLGRGVGGAIPRERVLRSFDVKKLPSEYTPDCYCSSSMLLIGVCVYYFVNSRVDITRIV